MACLEEDDDDEAEVESALWAVDEKHFARIDEEQTVDCVIVDEDADVSDRFLNRPVTVLRQVLDDAMLLRRSQSRFAMVMIARCYQRCAWNRSR